MSGEGNGFAAESGHWYTERGEPINEVPRAKPGKNGEATKPCTLREARPLNAGRGATTVIRQKYNPAIERYKIRQAKLSVATFPHSRSEYDSDDAWLAALDVDADAHAKGARDVGTLIHATLERGLRGESLDGDPYATWFGAFRDALGDAGLGAIEFQAERSAAHWMGYGCKLDAVSPTARIIIDHKGRELRDGEKPTPYFEVAMQLAAQREAMRYGLGERVPAQWRCFCGIFDRTRAMYHLVEVPARELDRGWRAFVACLALQRIADDYAPEWYSTNAGYLLKEEAA